MNLSAVLACNIPYYGTPGHGFDEKPNGYFPSTDD